MLAHKICAILNENLENTNQMKRSLSVIEVMYTKRELDSTDRCSVSEPMLVGHSSFQDFYLISSKPCMKLVFRTSLWKVNLIGGRICLKLKWFRFWFSYAKQLLISFLDDVSISTEMIKKETKNDDEKWMAKLRMKREWSGNYGRKTEQKGTMENRTKKHFNRGK